MTLRHPPSPARIGRYLIRRTLGSGGMSVVYAAYDPELRRDVALKVLRPDEGATAERVQRMRDRLLREAKAVAMVADPHVIRVFEVGAEGDRVYVALELIDGGTL